MSRQTIAVSVKASKLTARALAYVVAALVAAHGPARARYVLDQLAVMARTPQVFCAVSAVMAVMPKQPSAAIVFRSAWMPAPPPLSEPAMDSTRT